jgi:hypothetical protein
VLDDTEGPIYGAPAIAFDPNVPGDWSGPLFDVYAALNELAAAGVGSLPVVDTTHIIKGSADATKHLRFEVDGLTAATTRVITMADQDINLTPDSGTFPAALHAARHLKAAADAIKLDDLDPPDDNTDLNADTLVHGLLRKLDDDATHFLDGKGTWSAAGLLAHELQFYSSVNSIHGNLTALILDGGGTINLYTGGSPRATVSSGGLDVIGWCRAGAVRVDSAHGGIAGTITFTNATLAPSGAPSFIQAALPAAGGPGNLIADMWVEIKIGTVAYWFLAWTA